MAAVEPDQSAQTQSAEPTAKSDADTSTTGEPAEVSEPSAEEQQQGTGAAEQDQQQTKSPTFDIVRVEEDGAAVIAGQATPGAEIMLTLDGRTIGTAIANERGEWVVTPEKPLPPGNHDLLIVSRNGDGGLTTSDQVVSVAVPESGGEQPLIVLSENNQPSKVLQKPETAEGEQVAAKDPSSDGQDQQQTMTTPDSQPSTAALVMEAVDYNDQGDILFSGTAGPGETVRVYVDNIHIGDAVADQSGRWVYRGKSEIAPGLHTLRIDQVRTDGKVAQRRELPFERAEPSRVVELHNAQKQTQQAAEQTGETASSDTTTQQSGTTSSASSGSGSSQVASSDTTATTASTSSSAAVPSSSELEPLKLTGKVVIQPGNNLWNISRVIYGRGVRYSVIYEANKEQIRNPHRIYPGQIFTTPGIVPPTEIDPGRRDPLEYAQEPQQ